MHSYSPRNFNGARAWLAPLGAYEERRRPRVEWVRQQSLALSELARRPANIRDRALRADGAEAFR